MSKLRVIRGSGGGFGDGGSQYHGTLFCPDKPLCELCRGDVAWVAWTVNEQGRMEQLWFSCQECSRKFPRVRSDFEAHHAYGSKRAFFKLEDMIALYKPAHEELLKLVRFFAWAARQTPSQHRSFWVHIGGDPEDT